MSVCLVCLEPLASGDALPYHAGCIRTLFGTPRVPLINVELAKLHTLALSMVGHTSLSGIQRKVSLGLTVDRTVLQVATDGGSYILKPQAQTFPALPENEHVTMRLAALAGIEVPPCGLVRLPDDSLAYLIRRFDRPPGGGKRLVEDFCQLAQRPPKEKYDASSEQVVALLLQHASEPLVESLRLFRLLVFVWWTGNGDMHLKNFSLLREGDGSYRLSPAYDLLCTRLVIPNDLLALSVAGNKKNITPRQWMLLATACELRAPAAQRVLHSIVAIRERALALLERCSLPDVMKRDYRSLLEDRTKRLAKALA